jgi:beta-phosphoglucomutase-like phosphatase (HAD superfamily)
MIVLFDFDGVIADTESQYTIFWDRIGKEYLGLENFGLTIKGQTLVQIFDKYFKGKVKEQEEIVPALNAYEKNMSYDYIPGAYEFLQELRSKGIRSYSRSSRKSRGSCRRKRKGLGLTVIRILGSLQGARRKVRLHCRECV